MKKVGSNFKKNFTTINQNEMICPKNSLKERIRELIKKNDETIKKYELLKTQSKNSQKKMEYLKIISKFRTRQITLHNKLHGLDLIMNSYSKNYQNNIINSKTNLDNVNKIKNAFHKRINSSDYNYSAIYTNNNNNLLKNKNEKKNYNVNSTNNLSKLIPKPTKIDKLLPLKKKEIKKEQQKNNKKNFESYINDSNFLRINTNTNDYIINSTMIKNTNRQNNNYYIKTNNKNDSEKNIIIINNINNFFGQIENTDHNTKMIEHIIDKNTRKKIRDKILKYNIIDEDEQLDIDINDKSEETAKEKEFISNPNLIFRKKIMKIEKNVVIEIFNPFNEPKEIYFAISEKSFLGHNIKIFKFKNRKFITRLKKHKFRINSMNHFFNPIKRHDFLISGDNGLYINIWDISFKSSLNQFLFTIKYQGEKIYNLLPTSIQLKENDHNNYLLVYDKSITIYDLKDGNYLKNINHSRLLDEKIINIIVWKNKNNNLDYIIKCAEIKITIFNFIDSEIFFTLSDYTNNEDKNKYITKGCISSGNKKEFLCIFSYSSYLLNIYLEIWDLYELNLKEKIIISRNLINDAYLLNIIPWNYKYILFSDGNKNDLFVFEFEAKKIISKINTKYKNDTNHIYLKKVFYKEYGESLIMWKHNNFISLFSLNELSNSE